VTSLRVPFIVTVGEDWLAASWSEIHRREEVLVLPGLLYAFSRPLLAERDTSVFVEDTIVLAAASSR